MVQEIKTEKFEGVLVKLPENLSFKDIAVKADCIDTYPLLLAYSTESKAFNPEFIFELPQGQWKLIGNPFELNDAEIKLVTPLMKDTGYPFETEAPQDTFMNLLDKLHVYKENPHGDKSSILKTNEFEKTSEWLERSKKWQLADERTGNWILLEKIG